MTDVRLTVLMQIAAEHFEVKVDHIELESVEPLVVTAEPSQRSGIFSPEQQHAIIKMFGFQRP